VHQLFWRHDVYTSTPKSSVPQGQERHVFADSSILHGKAWGIYLELIIYGLRWKENLAWLVTTILYTQREVVQSIDNIEDVSGSRASLYIYTEKEQLERAWSKYFAL